MLRERVRAGLPHARQNGQRLGRPQTAAMQAGSVRKLYRAGVSKAEIARRLQTGRHLGTPYSGLTFFAWTGAVERGGLHYYRIQTPERACR
jgi:hypothetical protein